MSAQLKLKELSPELRTLPEGYVIKVDRSSHSRIYFQKGRKTSYVHPTLGPLPDPWIFSLYIIDPEKGTRAPVYYNPDTNQIKDHDPRYDSDHLQQKSKGANHSMATMLSGSVRRNAPGRMEEYARAEIGLKNIRHAFVEVHNIDPGDGTGGGMNGGVYVVHPKGNDQLLVEKRFKPRILAMAKKEIELLRRCRHGSLTQFCAAFINETSNPVAASVYVEYCDRGSLEELIQRYQVKRTNTSPQPEIPELFIWHAFLGLADGLAYLQGGRTFLGDETISQYVPLRAWEPILHRDIKPDNVLLKSRATSGETKYFYCVLSDFGLACEDNDEDEHQKQSSKLGTKLWWAPELCYNPCLQTQPDNKQDVTNEESRYFPSPHKHSLKSDVWALGAIIFNLTDCDAPLIEGVPYRGGVSSHISFRKKPKNIRNSTFFESRISRKDLEVKKSYSKQLSKGISYATDHDPEVRPNAIELVMRLRKLLVEGKIEASGPARESDKIPRWATIVHDYHSKLSKQSSK